ncbi:MAG: hypothetical protein MJE77_04270 [Proteobacteria bacterium]|nr:hypothetical protein [Pseudomonadota bacterium]
MTLEGKRVKTFTELAAAAAEGKKIAKELVGSSYVQNNQVIKGRRAK